jgi:4-amino-4-deoxy-L-arabinose transferase-like glycosyltransferase
LLALLLGTATAYLWGLGASGWANSYYSAAVQAGAQSWKAFFFGSTDAANFITVDKAPAFLWPMELAARVFGVNSWSILVPEALEGVAAVGLLYAAVRRWFTPAAGLLAGAVLALTPVAALMFRFNNPDALLVLLLTASAYAMTRALEAGRTGWLVLAGSLVGFGFLAKMLQSLLVVPAFALVYLAAGPPKLGRRLAQLCAAGGALMASAGWWVLAVQLSPAAARPYIGGSQNNSLWNLIFGYNGFGRLNGNETGSVGGGASATGAGRWGVTGLTRLFNASFGGQASWLLPAALIVLLALLAFTWRAPRRSRTRAATLLWGGWLAVTAGAISLGKGIIHPYYTVALGPPIAALVGIGGVMLWRRRQQVAARLVLATTIVVTAGWSSILLARTPTWLPGLRVIVLVTGLVAAAAVAAGPLVRSHAASAAAILAVVSTLTGPAAYTWATVTTPHTGAIPAAGPAGADGLAFGGAPRGAFAGGTGPAPGGGGGGGRGVGGILNASTPSAALTATLKAGSSEYTWVAAAISANQAAGYQLATGEPVMAIGGFNGTDPAPTLAQFQRYVAAGKIHYFIGTSGGAGGTGTSDAIASWVEGTYPSRTVGGVTLYDLTAPASVSSS